MCSFPPRHLHLSLNYKDKVDKLESARESMQFSGVRDELGLHMNVSSVGFFSACLGCCIPQCLKNACHVEVAH